MFEALVWKFLDMLGAATAKASNSAASWLMMLERYSIRAASASGHFKKYWYLTAWRWVLLAGRCELIRWRAVTQKECIPFVP